MFSDPRDMQGLGFRAGGEFVVVMLRSLVSVCRN